MGIKLNKVPIIISIILLLLPVLFNLHLGIGYFTFLRLVVFGTGAYLSYFSHKTNNQIWMWLTGLVALLFNPFIQVDLGKHAWRIIDVIASVEFLLSLFLIDKTLKEIINSLLRSPLLVKKWIHKIGIMSILLIITILITYSFLNNDVINVLGPILLFIMAGYLLYLIFILLLWLNRKKVLKYVLPSLIIILSSLELWHLLSKKPISEDNIRINIKSTLPNLRTLTPEDCQSFDISSAIPTKDGGIPDIFTPEGRVLEKYKKLVEDNYLHRDSSGVSEQQVIKAMEDTWALNKKLCDSVNLKAVNKNYE